MAARPLDGGVTAAGPLGGSVAARWRRDRSMTAGPLDGCVAARWRRGRGRTARWRRGREGEGGDRSSAACCRVLALLLLEDQGRSP
jgi:hypothetical protein